MSHLVNKIDINLRTHINLNLRTIVSKEFSVLEQKLTRPCTIEIDRTDFLWNKEGVVFAHDFLQSHNHTLCIDLISPSNLGLFTNTSRPFDYYKVTMSDDLFTTYAQNFEHFIKNIGAHRIILTRCDNRKNIEKALKMGITQFQGFLMEHDLSKTPPALK